MAKNTMAKSPQALCLVDFVPEIKDAHNGIPGAKSKNPRKGTQSPSLGQIIELGQQDNILSKCHTFRNHTDGVKPGGLSSWTKRDT